MSIKLFTSDLQMWSPTMSMGYLNASTEDFEYSATQPTFHYSHGEYQHYHHEPLFYPAQCMLCGLPHIETEKAPSPTSCPPAMTPAPVFDTAELPTLSIEKRHMSPLHHTGWMKKMKLSIFVIAKSVLRKLKQNRPIYPLRKKYEYTL